MYHRRSVVLAKIESVYGIDPAPAADANAILTSRPTVKVVSDKVERNFVSPTISPLAPQKSGHIYEVSFDVEARPSSAAGTPPEISPLLRACGLAETIVPATSVEYQPVSSGFESCAIWIYIDGICHKIRGCRGNVKLRAEAGKYGIYSFTMRGLYVSPVALAVPSPTYSDQDPEVVRAGTARLNPEGEPTTGAGKVKTASGGSTTVTTTGGGFANVIEGAAITANLLTRYVVAKVSNTEVIVNSVVDWFNGDAGYDWVYENVGVVITGIEFDLRNELFRRDDITQADAVKEVMIANRATGGSFDPEVVPLAARNFWAEFKNRTPGALAFGFGVAAQDNRIAVTCPRLIIDDISYKEKGPLLSCEIPFVCEYVEGDDEIKIKYL